MDWSLTMTLLAAVLGWFIAHRFSAARDRANKRREIQVSYLIDAFRHLGKVVHGRVFDYAADFESAVLDVQLRNDLRKELRLPEIASNLWWLRLEKKM
jgi:hypothetical protein